MSLLRTLMICAAGLAISSATVAQQSNTEPSPPAKQIPHDPPCSRPRPVFAPDPHPPDSWIGKAPKSAVTVLEVMVDKKGKVHDPVVIHSEGKDVDRAALDAVRQWRFSPAKCGKEAVEAKVNIEVIINLK